MDFISFRSSCDVFIQWILSLPTSICHFVEIRDFKVGKSLQIKPLPFTEYPDPLRLARN